MPPTRRKSAQQPTLTFNSRPNKITKPTSSSTPKTHKPIQKKVTKTLATPEATKPAPIPAEVDAKNVSEPTTAEVAIENQVKAELAKPELDEREETAKKVTDAQIKRYWKAKEQARKAPRVHQEGLSLHEKILREWDLSSQFGVCVLSLLSFLPVLLLRGDAFR